MKNRHGDDGAGRRTEADQDGRAGKAGRNGQADRNNQGSRAGTMAGHGEAGRAEGQDKRQRDAV